MLTKSLETAILETRAEAKQKATCSKPKPLDMGAPLSIN